MITKEDFEKVWKDSTREEILNQFYFEHNDLRKLLKENGEKEKVIKKYEKMINELEKEIDRLLERQYASERFAKENGFNTYLPAKENLLCVKNKLQELKGEYYD